MGVLKDNIGYFSHETDAPDHRKFLILRAYYGGILGWAMEARFWVLNCMIGQADGCHLDLTQKGEKARVARALEMSLDELAAFIIVLRDEAELVQDEDGTLWTDQTQEDLEHARAARGEARKRWEKKKKPTSGEVPETSPEVVRTSPEVEHGAERSGADRKEPAPRARDEPSAETGGGPPEEPAKPGPDDERGLYEFALARAASTRGVRNPAAWARKTMRDPDMVADYRASLEPKPRHEGLRFLHGGQAPPCLTESELREGEAMLADPRLLRFVRSG